MIGSILKAILVAFMILLIPVMVILLVGVLILTWPVVLFLLALSIPALVIGAVVGYKSSNSKK